MGDWWHAIAEFFGVSDGQLRLVLLGAFGVLCIVGMLGSIHANLRETVWQLRNLAGDIGDLRGNELQHMAEDLSTVVNAADQIGSSIDFEDLTKAISDGSKSVVEEIQKLSPTLNAIEMTASSIESTLQGMERNLSSVADSLAPDMTEYDP